MTVSEILAKMLADPTGDRHDMRHLLKVWAFAHTIGDTEGLDAQTQYTLELAAIVHDIACPSLRARFGKADGKLQEVEGGPMADAFLASCGVDDATRARVCYLVAHHHTTDAVDGIDYQILLEADYLVNADECNFPLEDVRRFRDEVFRTATGIGLIDDMYLRD